jgi:hypothetical protein
MRIEVVPMRRRTRTSRLKLPLAVLLLPWSLASAQAQVGVEHASRVAHVSVPVDGGFLYELGCEFAPGGVREHMSVVAVEEPDGSMGSSVSVDERESRQGRLIQVGPERFVEQERVEERSERHSFTRWGVRSLSGPAVAHFAVAVWDGDVSSCYAIVDDVYSPMNMYAGSYGFYAGPEAFAGGVFYQDGETQASVARTFNRALTGGPLFSMYIVSDNDPPRTGDGWITSDDVSGLGSVRYCAACSFARPHPTIMTAGTLFSAELSGEAHNQLWVINPPPG